MAAFAWIRCGMTPVICRTAFSAVMMSVCLTAKKDLDLSEMILGMNTLAPLSDSRRRRLRPLRANSTSLYLMGMVIVSVATPPSVACRIRLLAASRSTGVPFTMRILGRSGRLAFCVALYRRKMRAPDSASMLFRNEPCGPKIAECRCLSMVMVSSESPTLMRKTPMSRAPIFFLCIWSAACAPSTSSNSITNRPEGLPVLAHGSILTLSMFPHRLKNRSAPSAFALKGKPVMSTWRSSIPFERSMRRSCDAKAPVLSRAAPV
mmetsp:Transcript_17277/g.25405  ORF Transcript_17277/g.25405 Transcript_17277/m.25405 type:complete len:263 (-) Transcript_17277:1173-1961(-)